MATVESTHKSPGHVFVVLCCGRGSFPIKNGQSARTAHTHHGHWKGVKVRGRRHTELHRAQIVFVVVAKRHSAVAWKRGSRLSTLPNPPYWTPWNTDVWLATRQLFQTESCGWERVQKQACFAFFFNFPQLHQPTAWGKSWKQASCHTLLTRENNNKNNLYCRICRKRRLTSNDDIFLLEKKYLCGPFRQHTGSLVLWRNELNHIDHLLMLRKTDNWEM